MGLSCFSSRLRRNFVLYPNNLLYENLADMVLDIAKSFLLPADNELSHSGDDGSNNELIRYC